jgi:predicted AlkP superfamily phosphohydrolase/phosphomutase
MARHWRGAERRDWSNVRAFRLIGSDMEGQVQINLRGRERAGTVAPGDEYEALCWEIAGGLCSYVDADSGAPIVAEVLRTAQLWPEATTRRHLPDLVIRWADRSPAGLRALRSPRHGGFANPHVAAPPDGRSGHHQPMGWAIAAGPGIPSTDGAGERPLHDLAATIYARFGLSMPPPMRGEPIAAFLDCAPR